MKMNFIIEIMIKKVKWVLIIFVCNLEKGKVKIWLVKMLGEDKVLAIYKVFFVRICIVVGDVDVFWLLFYSV